MGKWLTCLPRLTLAQLRMLRSTTVGTCYRDLQTFPSPRWENALSTSLFRFSSFMLPVWSTCYLRRAIKSSHRPMGKVLADMPNSTLAVLLGSIQFCSTREMYVPATPAKCPLPRGFSMFCSCAFRAAVSLLIKAQRPSHRPQSLAIQLHMCVLTLKISHSPNGKIADALASTLACTTAADAPVKLQSVCATKDLESSHRPDVGDSRLFCSLFAGWWCLRPFWLSDHLIMHHKWELSSCRCACSCSKVPIVLLCFSHVSRFVLAGPGPGTQCLCRQRHSLHPGHDPHRHPWQHLVWPSL